MFLAEGFWDVVRALGSRLYALAVALGGPGVFLVAMADSSFISVPEGNDILIIILSTGQDWATMAYYVVMTTLGSILGCLMLFSVGRRGGGFLENRISRARIREMEGLYDRWGVWAVVVPSVLPPPTPFKVFVLSAGFFRLSYAKFTLAVAAGRAVRYFTWGILAVLYGEWAKEVLEHNLPAVGMVLALLLFGIIAGALWLRLRRKEPREEIA